MSLKLEWDNPERLLLQVTRLLREKRDAIKRVPKSAVQQGTALLLSILKRRSGPTPIGKYPAWTKRKGGTLVKSMNMEVVDQPDGGSEGRVGTFIKYAPFLEEGTGIYGPRHQPFFVRSRRGLFWGAIDERTGKGIVRRKVKILGMQPRAMFAKASAEFLPKFPLIVERALKEEMAKQGPRG